MKEMLEMTSQFEGFRKAIEPDAIRKGYAQAADDPVREHLEQHPSFAEQHVTTFLYGSYKRSTAVGDIKDVDIVVVTNYSRYTSPVHVLDVLKGSLAVLYGNTDLADQRRSIRVDRPLPNIPRAKLTLDVIPAIYQAGPNGPLWVPDRNQRIWVESHPKGHLEYTSALNARSYEERAFVRLVKMMKWWWKHQYETQRPGIETHKRHPKGFWIEVMVGTYADLSRQSYPELIVTLLENTQRAFRDFLTDGRVPTLRDPGLPNQVINSSMTADDFRFFLSLLEQSLGWAEEAYYASTERGAAEAWQRFFGKSFPTTPNSGEGKSLLRPAVTPGGLTFPDRPVAPRKPNGFA